ncbi:hypothetical protein AVEN_204314-1, partial [Araneus ventricosus]
AFLELDDKVVYGYSDSDWGSPQEERVYLDLAITGVKQQCQVSWEPGK